MAAQEEGTELQERKRTRAKAGTKAAAETIGPQLNNMQQVMSWLLRESGKNDDNRRELERLLAEGFAQVRVRQERHHKEQLHAIHDLTNRVERLCSAVEEKVLASDMYTVQAVRELADFKRELLKLPLLIANLLELHAPAGPAPIASAVGEGAIVLIRSSAQQAAA
jgi:hypothetical protein